jgi:hypothetical protein
MNNETMQDRKRTDIVYKVGPGSKADDWELRYSLRSVRRCFRDCGTIWIVGHCPEWLDGGDELRVVPWPDPYDQNKDANLIQKLILAGTIREVSAEFIFMSDDQIFLDDVTAEDCGPFYYWDAAELSAEDWAAKEKKFKWFKRLRRTAAALMDAGLPALNFETHTPQRVVKSHVRELLKWDYGAGAGYCVHSLLFNTAGSYGDARKLPGGFQVWADEALKQPEAVLQAMAGGAKVATFTPGGVNNWAPVRFIENIYPEAAPWEIDGGGESRAEALETLATLEARQHALAELLGGRGAA